MSKPKRRPRKSTPKTGARKLTPRRAKAHARMARDIALIDLTPPREDEDTPDPEFMRL